MYSTQQKGKSHMQFFFYTDVFKGTLEAVKEKLKWR